MLAIDHANVITPHGVIEGCVVVDGDRIVAVEPSDLSTGGFGPLVEGADVIDADGAWLCPGFIDLQVNGGFGIDLTTSPDRIDELGAALPRHGVTAFLPTIVSCPVPMRAAAMAAWMRRIGTPRSAAVPLGLHLEGPMLAPSRRGAHPLGALLPAGLDVIDGWTTGAGVAMVTIAPEVPGALEVIAELRRRGVVVSIGHTECSAAEFRAAREAGATYVTHLFNAMRPFAHRDPGPIGAALADSWAVVGLICDGIHVDPVAVAMAWHGRGPDRLTLVSDATAATGATGEAVAGGSADRLGEAAIVAGSDGVRTTDGVLAGGAVALDQAVRNLVAFTGCGVPSAVRTVTATPARVLGLRDRGKVEVGSRADLVLLDAALGVRTTIVGGAVAWSS